jgi:hypothetical protein
MQSLYFAYGSNLCSARLRARVAPQAVLGAARLPGHRLALDKRGRDGSGKANLHADPAGCVWGALYALRDADWPALDACEPGYARVEVEVERAGGERLRAFTYVSQELCADPVPTATYKRLLVRGAREHGLPAEWIARLESLPAR